MVIMSTPVKTGEVTKPNHIYDYLAIVVVIIGLGLFYSLKISIWLKWGIVIAAVALAFAMFFLISPTGLHLHGYIKDSWRELGKVVWPSRKEAMQFTWLVFLFVLILGLLLWIVDTSLSWLFYNVILGRGK